MKSWKPLNSIIKTTKLTENDNYNEEYYIMKFLYMVSLLFLENSWKQLVDLEIEGLLNSENMFIANFRDKINR